MGDFGLLLSGFKGRTNWSLKEIFSDNMTCKGIFAYDNFQHLKGIVTQTASMEEYKLNNDFVKSIVPEDPLIRHYFIAGVYLPQKGFVGTLFRANLVEVDDFGLLLTGFKGGTSASILHGLYTHAYVSLNELELLGVLQGCEPKELRKSRPEIVSSFRGGTSLSLMDDDGMLLTSVNGVASKGNSLSP
ncbi:OLC1v1004604C1 [Oldenlandia corymbosa var. corymbosa]|uniref:OLC1v1004604C1 n=1 Tax=Oldenlandia corymbosa var. corymbosa TaxID=529605 RepID=A0AAV1DCW7_OLDCO|nr:OLC1v1004604C1 [Oldenlandia corymbosa var. corymbosa]